MNEDTKQNILAGIAFIIQSDDPLALKLAAIEPALDRIAEEARKETREAVEAIRQKAHNGEDVYSDLVNLIEALGRTPSEAKDL